MTPDHEAHAARYAEYLAENVAIIEDLFRRKGNRGLNLARVQLGDHEYENAYAAWMTAPVPGEWVQTWEAEDGSPGLTFQPKSYWTEDVAEEDERYAEVSGHGQYRWQVGEPWENGRVLARGTADTIDTAKQAAEYGFTHATYCAAEPVDVVTIEMPGALADHLEDSDFGEPTRSAYGNSQRIGRGRGYCLRITASLDVHRELLQRCWVLEGGPGIDSTRGERKAYRAYERSIESAGERA